MFMPLQNRFVLVIDHASASRVPLCRILRELGARKVIEAASAREALESFKVYTSLIEAVVCERDLPKIDGLAVLKAIRMGRTPLPRTVPVLLLASDDDRAVRQAFQALDGTALLPRPVSPAKLADLLATGMKVTAPVREADLYAGVDTTLRQRIETRRLSDGGPNAREAALRESIERAEREEMTVGAFAVTDGMVLVRDLQSDRGTKLMKAGETLTSAVVQKLIDRGELTHDSRICVRREETRAA